MARDSRRRSTGDIRIFPRKGQYSTTPPSATPTNRTPRTSADLSQSPRNSSRSVSVRPAPPRRQRSFGSLSRTYNSESSSYSERKVKKVDVMKTYVLTKTAEKLEEDIMKKRANDMKQHPGPDPRDLLRKLPRKNISSTLDKMTIITNNIVIGSKRDAANNVAMNKLGITHVLNVAQQVPNYHPSDFIYHKVNILDDPSTNITDFYAQTSSFINRVEKLKGRVLVHCISGVSRSVAVVLMHFIGKYRMHLKNAYNHIYAVRPYIHPNNGFKYQLALFELEYLDTSSVANGSAGEAWSFYEWNSVKNQYRRQSVDGSEGLDTNICCSIS